MWTRSIPRRLGALLGGLCAACLLASGAADAAIYMKFDGIDGEATAENHAKWNDVFSVEWGLAVEAVPGGAGSHANVTFRDVEWNQYLDASFPDLFLAAASNGEIANVKIDFVKATDGKPFVYFNMTFEQVTINSLDLSSGGDTPVVHGKFDYEKISMSYIPIGASGRPGTPRTASFRVGSSAAPAAAALLSVYQLGITDPPAPAVPEPETWVLMALGLGVLTVSARRARQRRA